MDGTVVNNSRDEKQGSERVVAREGADGNNTKNDVDWGEYGMEKRDSGIVMMSQQPNQFGDITHEKCFLEGILNRHVGTPPVNYVLPNTRLSLVALEIHKRRISSTQTNSYNELLIR